MDREKCCETCKYHQHENISDGWICVNDKSERLADWTEYNNSCEEWTERKGGRRMNKYTITEEELKIWARLETNAVLRNDEEGVWFLRKLVCREKSWRKLKEAVEEEKNEDLKRIAQNIVNATEKVYDEMLRMFGVLEGEK